jgi:cytochrome b561
MSGRLQYDQKTIWLHWLTAGLVATLWGLAQIIDFFPNAQRVYPRSAHILLGVLLVLIYAFRLIWRNTNGAHLPPADTGWMHLAARAAHWGLYLLVAATLVAGLTYEAARADNILNLFQLPSIAPGDKALRRELGGYHELAANSVLILAGLHAVAALFHQYVLKDGVLRRMLPQ